MKQAIITFEPHRVSRWDLQAEAHCIAHAIRNGLCGRDYGVERGIVSIEVLDDPIVAIDEVDLNELARRAAADQEAGQFT